MMSFPTLETYRKRLEASLEPTFLQVGDASAAHAGHAGKNQAGPVSHLSVRIAAPSLDGLSQVAQHQKIYAILAKELASGALHAVQIQVVDSAAQRPEKEI